MSKIKIVNTSQLHDLDDVRSSVIFRGGEYFWKHDTENIISINTLEGEKHLYRKNSLLICKTLDGDWRRKKDCYKLGDDVWAFKKSASTVIVNGEPTYIGWTVKIGSTYYLKSDERVVKEFKSQNYILREDAVVMAKFYNKENNTLFVKKGHPELIKVDDEWYLREDCREVVEPTINSDGTVTKALTLISPAKYGSTLYHSVFYDFKDKTNPQYGRYDNAHVNAKLVTHDRDLDMYFDKRTHQYDKARILDARDSRIITEIKIAKEKFDKNYDEAGPDENNPIKWSKEYKTYPGKQKLLGCNNPVVLSRTFPHTAGLKYSFGVELETSGGMIEGTNGDKALRKLGVLAVGDRSIGAAEYVSSVLHGDVGIKTLQDMCELVAAHCMVDKRCGTHFHIGNVGEYPGAIDFDHRFAIAAIKLGCDIEPELYGILPPSRSPYNYHCNSILRYKDINEENWKNKLGMYLFGPREDQNSANVDETRYQYGSPGMSKRDDLGNWCGGRYKWLNLVRSYTASQAPTIEFRIFPGSTSFPKIYYFLMICMAYTYVCNNKYRDVVQGKFNLQGIVEEGLKKNPTLVKAVQQFIEERKKRFAGRIIYKTK